MFLVVFVEMWERWPESQNGYHNLLKKSSEGFREKKNVLKNATWLSSNLTFVGNRKSEIKYRSIPLGLRVKLSSSALKKSLQFKRPKDTTTLIVAGMGVKTVFCFLSSSSPFHLGMLRVGNGEILVFPSFNLPTLWTGLITAV